MVLTGALALSFSNLPIITLSPVILIDDGGMSRGAYAGPGACLWRRYCQHHRGPFYQGSDLSRFIWRTIPIQLTGLLVLLAGNIAWPHTVVVRFRNKSLCPRNRPVVPVLFRFALFSHSLPKGTVSATINIVALSFMAASVEVARWVYFVLAAECLSLHGADSGIVVIMLVSRLLKLRQQHLLQPA